jgi:type VI secretion system protein ImpK
VNPLIGAAAPLLALASQLRNTLNHSDPGALFRHVGQEIKNFEAAAAKAGAAPDAVLAARYALCTLVDEIVLNTPWGSQSTWASQTLLNVFHREGWGGEKFFQMVERVMQQPASNLNLLELFYLCMAMGLEGKYRVQSNGRSQLDAIQANVAQAIRTQRGEFERELSPHWRGVEDARPKLAQYVPLWAVAAAGAGLALLVYLGFLFVLNQRSDPVALAVAGLGRDLPQLVERQGFVPSESRLRLRDLLSAQAQQGVLEVRDRGETEIVILREGLFPSGSGEVDLALLPALQAVGDALNRIPGQILITGHTDDRPIRSLLFPSNWHLSKRRAESVRDILARFVAPERLFAEPRADGEPIVANDTPANRALNRRVEITLFAQPTRE